MQLFWNKYKKALAFFVLFFISLFSFKSFAHDAYFLQVLIDDHKYQYSGSIVDDNAGYWEGEDQHIEYVLGKFGGLVQDVRPLKADKDAYEDYAKDLNNDTMIFTFSPSEVSSWYGGAKNHATGEDVNKAYFVQENLMAGLSDALKIVNNGKNFTSIEQLMKKGNELAMAINKSGTIDGYTVTKGRAFDGKTPKGIGKDDYITIKKNGTDEVYEFIYRVKKGYVGSGIDEYEKDTKYLTWNQIMYQANYSYFVHGYTLQSSAELNKPNAVEEMVVGLLGNTFNQLRNLLGLYDINDLVFNDGIRGSSAWTHGIMSKDWSDKAIAYHWLFQALAWSVIIFAIVKALVQRNLATINPAMRISLMQSIQDLMITGVLLASAIPVINMFMFLNAQLVGVFGATAPDFANLGELNAYSNMIGGIIIQFFYLGVSIYLNFVYIMRAITIAILIATAPLFIVSIAFGGQWKQLFNTWMRELTGNIFLQSFHAFMLSFFFAISTSSRGIEGMIVLFALIPMTEFFRTMVMGSGGGVAHSLGMKSMAQGASMVGGAVGGKGSKKTNSGSSKGDGGGSGRETSTASGGMDNYAGNSAKIQNNSSTMTQRQRLQSNKESMGKQEMSLKGGDASKLEQFQTKPEGFMEKVRDKVEGFQEAKESLENNKFVNAGKGVASTALGASKVALGVGTAMAVGMVEPKMASSAMNLASSGVGNIKSGAGSFSKGGGSTLPQNTKSYATTLPNGDMQVHRSGKEMANVGIAGASMAGDRTNPIAKYEYDVSKLSQADGKNLLGAYSAFKNNKTEATDYYKEQGIQDMKRNRDGNLVVSYNQSGMEKLGIKSAQSVGSGANSRIVETKAPGSHATLHSLPIKRFEDVQRDQEFSARKQEEQTKIQQILAEQQQKNN